MPISQTPDTADCGLLSVLASYKRYDVAQINMVICTVAIGGIRVIA